MTPEQRMIRSDNIGIKKSAFTYNEGIKEVCNAIVRVSKGKIGNNDNILVKDNQNRIRKM